MGHRAHEGCSLGESGIWLDNYYGAREPLNRWSGHVDCRRCENEGDLLLHEEQLLIEFIHSAPLSTTSQSFYTRIGGNVGQTK